MMQRQMELNELKYEYIKGINYALRKFCQYLIIIYFD